MGRNEEAIMQIHAIRYLGAAVCGLLLAASAAPAGELGPPIRDSQRFTQNYVWSWKAIKEENIVMQRFDYSCGAATLATIARYYWGDDATEQEFLDAILRRLSPAEMEERVENGLSMTDLRLAAAARGYPATMGERTAAQMLELKVPVIVRIKRQDYEHFVVFRGVVGDRVFLADPIRGNVRQSFQSFLKEWTDGVVLVVAKADATELPKYSPLLIYPHSPVQPELQPVRRMIVLPRPDGIPR